MNPLAPAKRIQLRRDIFGWYNKDNKTPEYAPPKEGPCIVCSRALFDPHLSVQAPTVTNTVTQPSTRRCYFYKAHKYCWTNVSKRERELYEKCLLDLLNQGAV